MEEKNEWHTVVPGRDKTADGPAIKVGTRIMENACPYLSIIIVSFNTRDILRDCLKSVYSSWWRCAFEVIVVDNNSNDGSVRMVKEEFPEVVLVENRDNKLFAKANNQAATLAKGKYLLLLNSDTLVYDDNLQKMVDAFDHLEQMVLKRRSARLAMKPALRQHEAPDVENNAAERCSGRSGGGIICMAPKILNADHSLQSCGYPLGKLMERTVMCFKLHKLFPVRLVRALLLPTMPLGENVTCSVGWVSGSCMLMNAERYREVGGLSEKLEFYGEEPEFAWRTLYKFGYKTMYYADAEIVHLGGQSTRKNGVIDDEVRLHRYSLLVKETVGFRTGVIQSRIVVFAAHLKRLLSSKKQCFSDAINYEKKVIAYLRQCQSSEK